MMLRNTYKIWCGALLCGVVGCGPTIDTLDDIKSALNSELGGYQLDDELPSFGRSDLNVVPVETAGFSMPSVPAMGIAIPRPNGPTGVISGFWLDYEKGHGVMAGKWADASGAVRGHLKGVYGKSAKYKDWVFFGKLIDNNGRGQGVLSGRFHQGRFRGTWVDEGREILGLLEGIVVNERGFVGRWHAYHRPEPMGVGEIAWHLVR